MPFHNYAPPLADSRVASPVTYNRTTHTAEARRSGPPATGPTYFLAIFHNDFDTTLTELRTDKCLAATSGIADHVIEIDLLVGDEYTKRVRLARLLYLIQESAREKCSVHFPYTLAFFAHGPQMNACLFKLHQQLKMFWVKCEFVGPEGFADVLRVTLSNSMDQRTLACSNATVNDDERPKRDTSLQEILNHMDDFLVPNQPLNFTRVQLFDLYISSEHAVLATSEPITIGPLPAGPSDELLLPPICWTGSTISRDDGSEMYTAKLTPSRSSPIGTEPSAVLPVETLQNPEIYKSLRQRIARWVRGEPTLQHEMYHIRLWASMASSIDKSKLKELHIALHERQITLSSALCSCDLHLWPQLDIRIFRVMQGKIKDWNAQDEMIRLAKIEEEEARRRSRQQELPHATAKSVLRAGGDSHVRA